MPLHALAILILAAALHACWNLLVKRAGEKQVFTWWAIIVGSFCFLPVVLFSPALPTRVYPYILASAIAEAAYFVALTLAYKYGDFSLVYPIARGAAPALLLIWTTIFLGERRTPQELIGVAILLLGLMVVGGGGWWAQRQGVKLSKAAIFSALLVALCISIYSVIDGAAVKFVPAAPYTTVVLGVTGLLTAPAVLVRYGRQAMVAEWRANWVRICIVGVLSLVTFVLVLFVYSFAPVGLAGAVREISVVFAALLGWWWLNEGFGLLRTIGAALIFAGILTIALAG
ncbi:MAG TPA: DMT family transporter [Ktedonobacterales bacterium]|jgi:drug/metabolite transporter (DMT)-like permease